MRIFITSCSLLRPVVHVRRQRNLSIQLVQPGKIIEKIYYFPQHVNLINQNKQFLK